MTYEQLVKKFAATNGLSVKRSERALKSLFAAIREEAFAGRSQRIPTLGTFTTRPKRASGVAQGKAWARSLGIRQLTLRPSAVHAEKLVVTA